MFKNKLKRTLRKCVKKYFFLFFFRKMLMSAFLLGFKANYLKKKNAWFPHFSLWIIYFFRVVLTWRKNLCMQQAPSLKCALLGHKQASGMCSLARRIFSSKEFVVPELNIHGYSFLAMSYFFFQRGARVPRACIPRTELILRLIFH